MIMIMMIMIMINNILIFVLSLAVNFVTLKLNTGIPSGRIKFTGLERE